MNHELDRSVMSILFWESKINKKTHLRFNEISKLANIKKPTLQRVLPRLVKRGWVIKERFTPNIPEIWRSEINDETWKRIKKELEGKINSKNQPTRRSSVSSKVKSEVKKTYVREISGKQVIGYRVDNPPFLIEKVRKSRLGQTSKDFFKNEYPSGQIRFWKQFKNELKSAIKNKDKSIISHHFT